MQNISINGAYYGSFQIIDHASEIEFQRDFSSLQNIYSVLEHQ